MDQPLQVPPGRDVRLSDFDPDFDEGLDRADAEAETRRHCDKLDELAYRLFAEARRAVVVVLQGIDTSGKDGTIRMLASGISPQCLDVKSFKAPSALELSHDFLWRVHAAIPAHGARLAIFAFLGLLGDGFDIFGGSLRLEMRHDLLHLVIRDEGSMKA